MGFRLKSISREKNLEGKTVLVRVDSDVQIEKGKVVEDTRLLASLPTISYLLKLGAKVIIIGHLGRPEGKYDAVFSLQPVAHWYARKLDGKVSKESINGLLGFNIKENLYLLDNIRFYKEEEENSLGFARRLSHMADLYVNDAFAVSHRKHASISAVTYFLPSYVGFRLEEEVKVLNNVIEEPEKPLVVLIGGAKIETKLPMVERMHKVADYVLVGGEIAEQDKILIQVQHKKIPGCKSMVFVADLKENGLDITDKSVENFIQVINIAGTIIWNGPVGLVNSPKTKDDTERGTRELAKAIINSKAFKVVGGGDTIAFLNKENMLNQFDFVSTGGGAMLELLSGKKLPGIIPLMK